MPKLREKWDQLWLKAKAMAEGGGGNGREYKVSQVGKNIPQTASEKALDAKLHVEFEGAKRKFMAAKGYASEDDIPFDQLETFSMFKTRKLREMHQGGASC